MEDSVDVVKDGFGRGLIAEVLFNFGEKFWRKIRSTSHSHCFLCLSIGKEIEGAKIIPFTTFIRDITIISNIICN